MSRVTLDIWDLGFLVLLQIFRLSDIVQAGKRPCLSRFYHTEELTMSKVDIPVRLDTVYVATQLVNMDVRDARMFLSELAACYCGEVLGLQDCARKQILTRVSERLRAIVGDPKLWDGVQ